MSPIRASKKLVQEMVDAKPLPAPGAYGRRYLSRGLWGFYNPPRRPSQLPVEKAVKKHGLLIGYTIRKGGKK